MDFKSLTDWAIKGIIGLFLIQAIDFMRETRIGLADLSTKLAVIVEKVTNQDRLIDMHEKRIQQLERNAK
jgi:hypothetical protein